MKLAIHVNHIVERVCNYLALGLYPDWKLFFST